MKNAFVESRVCALLMFVFLVPTAVNSQNDTSSFLNFHFQQTVITQHHLKFYSPYSSINSLDTNSETHTTLTTTLFFGSRLWKNASLYFNPELAGGEGFSQARGMGGFTNGEAFRIGNPKPTIYLARIYMKQKFNLGNESEMIDEGVNQVREKNYKHQFSILAGKFCLADFFDNNRYSHDPRIQFQNWSLMSAGAWDYPANTRGYTVGALIEYKSPKIELRYAFTAEPTTANGPILNYNLNKVNGNTLEIQYNYSDKGNVKLIGFYNNAPMGSYNLAIKSSDTIDITLSRSFGRSKYGFAMNWEQALNGYCGLFGRVSWNDGKNETWAFTEIDQSAHLGFSMNGNLWHRNSDCLGIAFVSNGLSQPHYNYLKAGGYGFMLGDGKINYSNEYLAEIYYSFQIPKWKLSISPDYQCILNPGFNKDHKGPVHVFAARVHIGF